MNNDPIVIHMHGACRPDPGPGGWAVLFKAGGFETTVAGHDPDTTGERMELTAAIKALETLPLGATAVLYTYSGNVVNGITRWLPRWKANGWKSIAQEKPVPNRDLWERLDRLNSERRITWWKVKDRRKNETLRSVKLLATAQIRRSPGPGCAPLPSTGAAQSRPNPPRRRPPPPATVERRLSPGQSRPLRAAVGDDHH